MHSKWVLKRKRGKEGVIERSKARLVVCGNEDTILSQETFATVVDFSIVRLFLAIAGQENWITTQLDFKNAFLQANIDRDVYVDLQKKHFCSNSKTHVCKLKKSLYGLKEAPKLWFERLENELEKFKFNSLFRVLRVFFRGGE